MTERVDDPSAKLDPFIELSSRNGNSPARRGLYFALLAWSTRHQTNLGDPAPEILSEKFGQQAMQLVGGRLGELSREPDAGPGSISSEERLALMAAMLMIMAFKTYRGDMFGYREFRNHLKSLAIHQYATGTRETGPDRNISAAILGLMLMYDSRQGSFLMCEGDPVVSPDILAIHKADACLDGNLGGLYHPMVHHLYRLSALMQKRRQEPQGDAWIVEQLSEGREMIRQVDALSEAVETFIAPRATSIDKATSSGVLQRS
ncbi:hypothetical protein JCM24511_09905 [Saitozyma sp. JCM 24511]|nr:hypothetical protein JCM24511_09905 [Saitozyma sp. JCM 24511]